MIALVLLLPLLRPLLLPWHEGLEQAIARVSRSLEAQPELAELWVQRARLYRLHRDFARAEADLITAQSCTPPSPAWALEQAQLLAAEQRPADALAQLATFLDGPRAHDEAWAEGMRLRAACQVRLAQPPAARATWEQLLAADLKPSADDYLALCALEEDEAALPTVEAGLQRLGPCLPLALKRVELLESCRGFHAARAALAELRLASPRQEAWWLREAQLAERHQAWDEAAAAYTEARAAVARLSPSRQRSFSMQTLLQACAEGLKRIAQAKEATQ